MKPFNELIDFLRYPLPLWNVGLVDKLIARKWKELEVSNIGNNDQEYNTANILVQSRQRTCRDEKLSTCSYLEVPDFDNLAAFYDNHGLEPIQKTRIQSIDAVCQLQESFGFLDRVGDCGRVVSKLAKRVQVLKQFEPEFDISYSHPAIPFTIFVSVGERKSYLDVIRLSESILHEAMHLYLTLIEQSAPMIADSKAHYYSPWRDEMRPVRGVIHGMFVFRAILDFYKLVLPTLIDPQELDFTDWRIAQISSELNQLVGFPSHTFLTSDGANLARNLLP